MLDLEAIARTKLTCEPFHFFLTPGVLSAVDLAAVRADFPYIKKPGIFPLSELTYGPAFAKLIDEMRSQDFEDVIAEKYGVDLSDKPLMITVRGLVQRKDGRIHTDTDSKFVTCLLYLNDIWDESGGRLRMLRNSDDVDDFIAEIEPSGGTFASFLRSDNSWHGHKPHEGERRCILLNWMVSFAAMERELDRHRFSAKIKRLKPFV